MGPVCACGCGEYLPEGSTRNYKRGHKSRAPQDITDSVKKISGNDFFSGADVVDSDGEFTIFHAAESTPNDPEPADMQQASPYSVPVKITASVRKDIVGKLAFMFSMTGNVLQLADPVCGGAILENSGRMAQALMPIICQSPSVVKWFRSSTNYMMYINFIMACAPVFGAIYSHHMVRRPEGEKPPETPFTQNYYGVQ